MMNAKNTEEEKGNGSRCTDRKRAADDPRGSAAEVRRRKWLPRRAVERKFQSQSTVKLRTMRVRMRWGRRWRAIALI
jgi:hypothetical protein